MWIVSTLGFFSIVEKPWDPKTGTLTVRARARQDLEQLRDAVLPELGAIREDDGSDYRFRAQAPKAAVANALRQLAERIDYDNFKDAVGDRQGEERAHVYHDVWAALFRIQKP